MSQEIRRELISRNLGITPISHGQVYTFQIAIPESATKEISLEHRQAIERIFTEYQSNLISLIVRRTDAYTDEDIEYEVVYGSDWLQVAQALKIEMLWAWVFDMTDEQVLATQEMFALLETPQAKDKPSGEGSIDQKLQILADSIHNSVNSALEKLKNNFDEKIKNVQSRIDLLNNNLNDIPQLLERIEDLSQKLESKRLYNRTPSFDGPKLNLLAASEKEIENALRQINTSGKQIEAAIKALKFWKASESGLTWMNLEQSARAKVGTKFKVEGFAKGSLARLQAIGELEH